MFSIGPKSLIKKADSSVASLLQNDVCFLLDVLTGVREKVASVPLVSGILPRHCGDC